MAVAVPAVSRTRFWLAVVLSVLLTWAVTSFGTVASAQSEGDPPGDEETVVTTEEPTEEPTVEEPVPTEPVEATEPAPEPEATEPEPTEEPTEAEATVEETDVDGRENLTLAEANATSELDEPVEAASHLPQGEYEPPYSQQSGACVADDNQDLLCAYEDGTNCRFFAASEHQDYRCWQGEVEDSATTCSAPTSQGAYGCNGTHGFECFEGDGTFCEFDTSGDGDFDTFCSYFGGEPQCFRNDEQVQPIDQPQRLTPQQVQPTESPSPSPSPSPSASPPPPPPRRPPPPPTSPSPTPTPTAEPSPTPEPTVAPTVEPTTEPPVEPTTDPTEPTDIPEQPVECRDNSTRDTLLPDGQTAIDGDVSVTVSDTSLELGADVVISGEGWLPGSTVFICLFSAPVLLGTASVDGNGNFRTTVRIPDNVDPGAHSLVMSGLDANALPVEVSVPVTVLAADGDNDGDEDDNSDGPEGLAKGITGTSGGATASTLPATGGGAVTLAVRALLLLLTGGGALYATRRRPGAWLRA